MTNVCIIGLGYVGLPLAQLCKQKGHVVSGFDIDAGKVSKLNSEFNASTDPAIVKDSEVVLVCVPTPVNEDKTPNLDALVTAVGDVSENLQKGQLVIIESTIFPGTTEEIVKPLLEESGLKAGSDFFLAHCPERIDPGNQEWTVENIPRVLGAFTAEGAVKAREFYKSILEAPISVLSSLKSAEAVKVVENTFRDINIAYVNELAKGFDNAVIDLVEVIKGASTKPFGFMPHYPGCGVGGHCIPVDPYYLIDKAKQEGFKHTFLKLAREINESMPSYTVGLLKGIADLKDAKVGILGISYKGNVDDIRGSPGLKMLEILEDAGARTEIFDPFVPGRSTVKSIDELLEKSDYVIVATAHDEFLGISAGQLKHAGIKAVIDGRNCLDKGAILDSGVLYKGIGR